MTGESFDYAAAFTALRNDVMFVRDGVLGVRVWPDGHREPRTIPEALDDAVEDATRAGQPGRDSSS